MQRILISIILLFSIQLTLNAVRLPEYYESQIDDSEIKALARIDKVSVIDEHSRKAHKRVQFTLLQSLSAETPKTFYGTCYSAKGDDAGVGGDIYYYPEADEEVLVTIQSQGGPITSMTSVTPELKRSLKLQGLTGINFSMGKALVDENEEREHFLFYLNGKPSGYLTILEKTANSDLPSVASDFAIVSPGDSTFLYQAEIQIESNDYTSLKSLHLQVWELSEQAVLKKHEQTVSFQTAMHPENSDGVLQANNAGEVTLPPSTTTDLLLFPMAETLDFNSESSLKLNILETFELNLKHNALLHYVGKDPQNQNLHRFEIKDSGTTVYLLDDQHCLQEVQWDTDKRFVRMDWSDICNTLLP